MEALGVDIGGTNLRVARVHASGAVAASLSERISRDPATALRQIVGLARELDSDTVVGLGVGIPGRVDAGARRVLSGGFVDLSGISLAESVEAALGKRVVLDTDCNMALVAELQLGAARSCRNVVMLTIGTGIGGAAALDGALLRGRSSAAQFGHITVDPGGELCACGRRGCVETTSSGTALGRLIAKAALPPGTQVETLLASTAARDPVATRILTEWIGPLRAAIDSLVAALDPECVVLGGGLGNAACEALRLAPPVSPWYQSPVVATALGNDAGVIGAACSAIARSSSGSANTLSESTGL